MTKKGLVIINAAAAAAAENKTCCSLKKPNISFMPFTDNLLLSTLEFIHSFQAHFSMQLINATPLIFSCASFHSTVSFSFECLYIFFFFYFNIFPI